MPLHELQIVQHCRSRSHRKLTRDVRSVERSFGVCLVSRTNHRLCRRARHVNRRCLYTPSCAVRLKMEVIVYNVSTLHSCINRMFWSTRLSIFKKEYYPKALPPSRPAHDLQVASAVFLPSTGALVVSGRDGTLRIFRISSRRLPPAPVPHGTTATKATQVIPRRVAAQS